MSVKTKLYIRCSKCFLFARMQFRPTQSVMPLIHCFVDNVVIKVMPLFCQSFFSDDWCRRLALVDSLLEMQICEVTLSKEWKSLEKKRQIPTEFCTGDSNRCHILFVILFKSVQVSTCYCRMFRGLTFSWTQCSSGKNTVWIVVGVVVATVSETNSSWSVVSVCHQRCAVCL